MDKLGRQLEAVHYSVLIEFVPTQEQRDEFLAEWREEEKEQKKERPKAVFNWLGLGRRRFNIGLAWLAQR